MPWGYSTIRTLARPEPVQERGAVAADPEQDEVGPDPVRVQAAGRGLGDPAGRHDSVELGQALGQPARVGMVVGQALDHPVRAVAQGDEAGGGEDPDLAQPATDELAAAARPPDEVLRADDDRADRAAEPLREAERSPNRPGRPGLAR